MSDSLRYRGRFAPSPTGALHFGSLLAALASYLDARSQQGDWLLRIEDVDATRTVAGAADDILRTLEHFGFEWDGTPLWQSGRTEAYQAALIQLQQSGNAYGCTCTRKEIADAGGLPAIDGGLTYPGTCRQGLPAGVQARAWRMRVDNRPIHFEDRIQGKLVQHLETDVGDFVLLRADGQFAYQLAVVVDDAAQGITNIVRGADLIDSTPRQLWIQQCLGLATPRYAHIPVATNVAGEKLSKQTLAAALDAENAPLLLWQALRFLGQQPPEELKHSGLQEIWQWAFRFWQFSAIPQQRSIVFNS